MGLTEEEELLNAVPTTTVVDRTDSSEEPAAISFVGRSEESKKEVVLESQNVNVVEFADLKIQDVSEQTNACLTFPAQDPVQNFQRSPLPADSGLENESFSVPAEVLADLVESIITEMVDCQHEECDDKEIQKQDSSDGNMTGGSNLDDYSSVESTANSGLKFDGNLRIEDTCSNSSEDCASNTQAEVEGSVVRKKRIDLRHQFVRGIVKIQQDRDEYEKQWQAAQQEKNTPPSKPDKSKLGKCTPESEKKKVSKQATVRHVLPNRKDGDYRKRFSIEDDVRQLSSRIDLQPRPGQAKATQDQDQSLSSKQRFGPVYRPPNLRKSDAEDDRSCSSRRCATVNLARGSPHCAKPFEGTEGTEDGAEVDSASSEAMNLKVTFDTHRQERHIQLSKNFLQVGDARKGGKRIDQKKPQREEATQVLIDVMTKSMNLRDNELPRDFEFKATGLGIPVMRDQDKFQQRRNRSSRASFGSSSSSRGIEEASIVAASQSAALQFDNMSSSSQLPDGDFSIRELPPRDKPFKWEDNSSVPAKSKKWADAEEDDPLSPILNWSSPLPPPLPTPPDEFDSNTVRLRNVSSRRTPQSQSVPPRTSTAPPSWHRHAQKKAARNRSGSSSGGEKTSVWERLGPRAMTAMTEERSRLVDLSSSEAATVAFYGSLREVAERQYLCSNSNSNSEIKKKKKKKDEEESSGCCVDGDAPEVVVQAYKDSKQKRSRIQLYVPRRGGSQNTN